MAELRLFTYVSVESSELVVLILVPEVQCGPKILWKLSQVVELKVVSVVGPRLGSAVCAAFAARVDRTVSWVLLRQCDTSVISLRSQQTEVPPL